MRSLRMRRDLGQGAVTSTQARKRLRHTSAQVLVLSLFSRLALEPKFKKPRALKGKVKLGDPTETKAKAFEDAL